MRRAPRLYAYGANWKGQGMVARKEKWVPLTPTRQGAASAVRFNASHLAMLDDPYPNRGAVFAAGTTSWESCLSANGYQNSVSPVTENALRAFLMEPSAVAPEGPQ